MNKKILLSSPHMSSENYEKRYVEKAFQTNWIAPLGENVDEFENAISNYVHSENTVCLCSGTSAIHMALKAAGTKKNDIVFVQDLTFSASVNPIIYEGATPVFIDSEKTSYNMCYKSLEKSFKKYPGCKIVIVVHLYGVPANLDKIIDLCNKNNAVLIEDSAESLGSLYKDKYTGTIGKFGVYSFNGNKIITTSMGGAIVTNELKSAEKIKFWATQSKEKAVYYKHKEIGYNYRLSNVLAGIGLGQMMVLEDRIKKKTEIYNLYKKELSEFDFIRMQSVPRNTKPNHWLSALTFNKKINPLDIVDELSKHGIEARPIWKPMHTQPVFKKYDYIKVHKNSVSESIYNSGLCLPSDTKMTLKEQKMVIDILKNIIKKYQDS